MELAYDRLIKSLFAKADKSGLPLSGSFELTSRCTLNCKMCYIHRNESDKSAILQEKDTSWWLYTAKKAKDAGTLLLLLTGGEPMVRQDFDEIYSECKKMGFLLSVNTNATLIDENKIRLFSELPPQRLNISLYGTSRETYLSLCGNADAYDKTVNAIKELKKKGINIKLNYSVTPYNSADMLNAYNFAKSLELPIQSVSYMFAPVRSCGEAVRLSPAEAAKARFDWQRHHLGNDEDFTKFLQYKQDSVYPYDEACGERINCRAGLSTFWITYDGKMTPCGMMTKPSVPADDFSAAWQNILAERESILLPKKCLTCDLRKVCDMCAAVAIAECGNSGEAPPYACAKAKEYNRLCEEFLKSQN